MISKEIKGNLVSLGLKRELDVIVQNCNCFCVQGAGLALEIKNRIPVAYSADCYTQKGDMSKLGRYSQAQDVGTGLIVVNMYCQYEYGSHKKQCDYEAVYNGFTRLNKQYGGSGLKIGIPVMFASGLAGGNWGLVKLIIEKTTPDLDITLVEFDGSK